MTNKYFHKRSRFSVIRIMQNRTILRFYLRQVWVTAIKSNGSKRWWGCGGGGNIHCYGNANWCNHMAISARNIKWAGRCFSSQGACQMSLTTQHPPKLGTVHGEMALWFRVLASLTEFNSQYHIMAQNHPGLTQVLGNLIPSSGFCGHQACMWYTVIDEGKYP